MFESPPAITAPAAACDAGDRLIEALLRRHRQADHHTSAAALRRDARRYAAQCPALDAAGRLLELARLVARVGDAHTLLPLLPLPGEGDSAAPFTLIPLRFELFDDGLYVVGADGAHAALVGQRVVAIGALHVDAAMRAAAHYLPGDAPRFADEYAPEWLSISELLVAIGAARRGEPIVLSLAGGATATLRPPFGHRAFDWLHSRTAPSPGDGAPRRLLGPDRHGTGSWAAARLAGPTLYLRFDELREQRDGALDAFLDDGWALIDGAERPRLIVDLRDCIGGDGTINRRIVRKIADDPRFGTAHRLVVLIGRRTHSAAIMLVGALQRLGATTVGQPTGDGASHFGETQLLGIAETGKSVLYATEYYVTGRRNDHARWIVPDIAVPFRFADFRAGRDAALDRAVALRDQDR